MNPAPANFDFFSRSAAYLFSAGSTGDPPVPSGDSPYGTATNSECNNASLFLLNAASIPLGESPSGAGRSSAPPALNTYRPARPRADSKRGADLLAFTLVELLVVISIIALLAGLTIGLSGIASRKSKESRIRGDLNRLVTLIENYKARLGSYPPSPDGLTRDTNGVYDVPTPRLNQLFYELSGTIFTNPPSSIQNGRFYVVGRQPLTALTTGQILQVFQADGFANSARDKRNVKFTAEFKAAEVKEVIGANNIHVEILAVAVLPPLNAPPTLVVATITGTKVYPWYYDASSPNRMNADGFDLWTVVQMGKKIIRFSNWEAGPVVLSP